MVSASGNLYTGLSREQIKAGMSPTHAVNMNAGMRVGYSPAGYLHTHPRDNGPNSPLTSNDMANDRLSPGDRNTFERLTRRPGGGGLSAYLDTPSNIVRRFSASQKGGKGVVVGSTACVPKPEPQ